MRVDTLELKNDGIHKTVILLYCICVKSFEPNCIVWYNDGKVVENNVFGRKGKFATPICENDILEKKIIRDPSSTLCSAS